MVSGGRRAGQRDRDLPRLVLIADGFTNEHVATRAAKAVAAGARWVHLRDHSASPVDFQAAAERMTKTLRAADPATRISVNARLDVARALSLDFNTGARGPSIAEARTTLGPGALIGYSSHAPDEARAAFDAEADYIFFSPVFPTPSKPDHPGAGLDALRACCAAVPGPVLALGGVTPQRVAACLDAGAHGVAVLSGILHADDSRAAAEAYLKALS